MNTHLFVAIVLISLVLNVVIALFRSRGLGWRAYASDPKRYGWIVIAISMTGTVVGGGMFLAVAQIGYDAGIAGYVLGVVYVAGFGMTAMFARPITERLWGARNGTLIDVVRDCYGTPVTVVFSLTNAVLYLALLAAQFVATFQFVSFLSLHGLPSWVALTLIGLAVGSALFYPIVGGLRKDVQTDILQVLLIALGSAFILEAIWSSEAAGATLSRLPSSHLTGMGYGSFFVVGVVLFLTPSFLVRMDVWQRFGIARNTRSAALGMAVAGVIACVFYFLFTTVGMQAYLEGVPSGKFVALEFLSIHLTSPVSLALVAAAFFAAVMSSADTFINGTALFLTSLLWRRRWENTSPGDESALLRRSRFMSLFVGVAGVALARVVPDLVDLLSGAFSLLLAFLPVVLGILFPQLRNSRAAFASSVTSLGVFLVAFFFWDPKQAFVPAVLISGVVFFLILKLVPANSAP